MWSFLTENGVTILVAALVAVLLILAIRYSLRHRGGCSGCPHQDGCSGRCGKHQRRP